MRVHVPLLLVTASLVGMAIGIHEDGHDLGWWLMVAAGFCGSWTFVPLVPPPRDSRGDRPDTG